MMLRLLFISWVSFLGLLTSSAFAVDFDHDVVPILRQHCVECHGGTEAKGGFSMNTRDLFLESGAADPGSASDSYFIDLIRSDDVDLQMPPRDRPRLTAKQQAVLVRWIDAGMPWTPGFSFASSQYSPPLLPRQVELPGPPEQNPIDQIIGSYLAEQQISPPSPIGDAAFLRRASLDLTGLLPTPETLAQFNSDSSPDKRDRLIDELLSNNIDYADHWLTFWNDLLRNDYTGTGFITGGRKQISQWLYQSLLDNKPFDQFTSELVAPPSDASRGFIDGIKWRGEVSAGQTNEIQFAQSVAQSLLGINLKCASCHDSFIDRWTLSEAYSLAAVYAERPLEIHRCDKPIGETAQAGWLFPELGQIDPEASRDQRLKQLADLVTHRNNGRFARTIVNRLWAQLMGRGIVHPLDAMHTEPWNADLLDYLAEYLVENDYDLKAVLRLIATSDAYASKSESLPSDPANETDYVYRGRRVQRMTAEQFIDAVWQLTGAAPEKIEAPITREIGESKDPPMVRASLMNADFLMRSLGRPNRDQIVTSRPNGLTTLEAIDLANGATLANYLSQGAKKWHSKKLSTEELADQLYRFALSRPPSKQESAVIINSIGRSPDAQAIEDLLWAICMKPEFLIIR